MRITINVETLAALAALQAIDGISIDDSPAPAVEAPKPRKPKAPAIVQPGDVVIASAPAPIAVQPPAPTQAPATAAPSAPRANAVVYHVLAPVGVHPTVHIGTARIGGNNRVVAAYIAHNPGVTARQIKDAHPTMKPKAIESALHSLRTAGVIQSVAVA